MMTAGKERPRMLPVGLLMIEHRLIERMLALMSDELDRIGKYGRIDADFIDDAVDFMRSFTDVCHHGKEEKILFPALGPKPLSRELRTTMDELVQEHIYAREIVNRVEAAKESYLIGERDATANIIAALNTVIEFYPRHIAREDKHFFIPSMGYFSEAEKERMLQAFIDYDSRLVQEKYSAIIAMYKGRFGKAPGT